MTQTYSSEQIRDVARGQDVVDVDKEAFVNDLGVGQHEQRSDTLHTSLW